MSAGDGFANWMSTATANPRPGGGTTPETLNPASVTFWKPLRPLTTLVRLTGTETFRSPSAQLSEMRMALKLVFCAARAVVAFSVRTYTGVRARVAQHIGGARARAQQTSIVMPTVLFSMKCPSSCANSDPVPYSRSDVCAASVTFTRLVSVSHRA